MKLCLNKSIFLHRPSFVKPSGNQPPSLSGCGEDPGQRFQKPHTTKTNVFCLFPDASHFSSSFRRKRTKDDNREPLSGGNPAKQSSSGNPEGFSSSKNRVL
ncbi:hypothetical protein BOX30_01740 [Leptospirillum ferriphilum]|nr:hypothetical protein BOX30_01740 [Leptospirillum ferriphilum]